jgi:signal transduction histidine kinase
MLLLNLSVLTILLLVVFGSLYLTTYSNIQSRIDDDLRKLSEFRFISDLPPEFEEAPDNDDFNPERTVGFIIIIDENEIIIESYSQFDADLIFFSDALENVTDTKGKFVLEDSIWAYEVSTDYQGTKIVFLDVTAEQEILSSLVIRFIGIFALSFIAVYILSSFITKKAIAPVKESFDKQKQFISDASHELKTPLAVMNTNIDVLLSKDGDHEDQKWLKYIKDEISRMDKLTKDLLYLANVSEDQSKDEITGINISSKLESIALSIEPLAYKKHVTIHTNIEDNITVQFNDQNLHQIILILLENAIKYNIEQGIINVTLHKKSNHTYLEVSNTGVGIKEVDIPHIFDRFYKGDKSRKNTHNSYGLGLSIAHAIMERNGGTIEVESKEKELTTFTLKFK